MELAPHLSSFGVVGLLLGGALLRARWLVARLEGARWWALAAAAAVLMAMVAGPIDRLGEERSITVHVLQHMALFTAVPVLLLAGLRPILPDLRESSPATCARLLLGGMAVIWAVHVPAVMDLAIRTPSINDVSHLLLVGAGVAIAWPLAAPRPLGGMRAIAYLAAAELAIGVLGIVLTWAPELMYDTYADAAPLWTDDPKTDQMLSGAVLLGVEEPLLMVEVAVLVYAAIGEDGGG